MTKSEKAMIKSCFTYGYIYLTDKNRYLYPIIKRCGLKAVKKELESLKNKYLVISNTYTDIEGCNYNSLIAK